MSKLQALSSNRTLTVLKGDPVHEHKQHDSICHAILQMLCRSPTSQPCQMEVALIKLRSPQNFEQKGAVYSAFSWHLQGLRLLMTCRSCKACCGYPLGPRVSWSLKVPSLQVLRGKIDNLRRERLVFDDIFKKLEKSLQLQKKEMAGIIHISNGAFDTREKASTCTSASHAIQLWQEEGTGMAVALHDISAHCLGLSGRSVPAACQTGCRAAASTLHA